MVFRIVLLTFHGKYFFLILLFVFFCIKLRAASMYSTPDKPITHASAVLIAVAASSRAASSFFFCAEGQHLDLLHYDAV